MLLYAPASGVFYRALSLANDNTFAYVTGAAWVSNAALHVGDFDGDGLDDVFVYHPPSGSWNLNLSTADGAAFYTTATGQWLSGLDFAVGDFDYDSRADLFAYGGSGQWYELINTDGVGHFVMLQQFTLPLSGAGLEVASADVNGDSRADLVFYVPSSGAWAQMLRQAEVGTACGSNTYYCTYTGTWEPNQTVLTTTRQSR
jgi:hypothetical protein